MTATRAAELVMRVTGPAQVVLGLLFWVGWARGLLPVHMAVGAVFTLALLVLAAGAGRAGLARGATLLVLWALAVPAFGMLQMRLLPGGSHRVVQAAHLLIGLAAMGIAGRLLRRMKGDAGNGVRGGDARTAVA